MPLILKDELWTLNAETVDKAGIQVTYEILSVLDDADIASPAMRPVVQAP